MINTREIAFETVSGIGFDVHPIQSVENDHAIFLCGVVIPCRYVLIAHSDGDVALHALADAILGAIGAGDIGEHFPPSDSRWKNAASSTFIEHVIALCEEKKAFIVNVDMTLICEYPTIKPYKSLMKENLATLLKLPQSRINIKATTTEKLGFLGRSEGIAAMAIVSAKIPL